MKFIRRAKTLFSIDTIVKCHNLPRYSEVSVKAQNTTEAYKIKKYKY